MKTSRQGQGLRTDQRRLLRSLSDLYNPSLWKWDDVIWSSVCAGCCFMVRSLWWTVWMLSWFVDLLSSLSFRHYPPPTVFAFDHTFICFMWQNHVHMLRHPNTWKIRYVAIAFSSAAYLNPHAATDSPWTINKYNMTDLPVDGTSPEATGRSADAARQNWESAL